MSCQGAADAGTDWYRCQTICPRGRDESQVRYRSLVTAQHQADQSRGYNLAPSQSKEYDDTPRGASRIFNSINFQTQFRASGRTNSEDTGEKSKKRKAPSTDSTRPAKKGEPSASTSNSQTIKTLSNGTDPESRATTITSQDSKPSRKGKEKESLPKIRDNESLGDYNRRIESLLRPGVSKAIKSAQSVRTQQVRDAKEAKQRRKQGIPDPALAKDTPTSANTDVKPGAKGKATDESDDKPKNRGGKVHDVSDPAKEFKSTERRRLNDIVQAPPMLAHLKKGMGPGGKKKASGGETSAWKATGRTPLNAGQVRILNAERERVVKAYREIKAEREVKRAAARAAEAKP